MKSSFLMTSMLYYKLLSRVSDRDAFALKVRELGFDEHAPRRGSLPRCLVPVSRKKFRDIMSALTPEDQNVLTNSLKDLCCFSADALCGDNMKRAAYNASLAAKEGKTTYEKFHKDRYQKLKEKYPDVPTRLLKTSQAAIDEYIGQTSVLPG
jgi:hypothetical protein